MIVTIILLIIFAVAVIKYPPLVLLLYLTTTFVKATLLRLSIFQLVDYTIVCAVLTIIAAVYSYLRQRQPLRDIFGLPMLLYLSISMLLFFSLSYTSAPNYGLRKSVSFATFGFVAFIAPIVFGKDLKNFKLMIWIILISGVVIGVGTLIAPHAAVLPLGARSRSTFLESNPLSTANSAAWSAIIFFVFMIIKNTSIRLRNISIAMIALMIVVIIITASRGPFIGLFLVFIAALFACRRYASKAWRPLAIILVFFAVTGTIALMPEQATARITGMWKSKYDTKRATQARTVLFAYAFSHWIENPVLGHGVGQWGVDYLGVDERAYPHNIFLELLYEQGIVGLVLGIAIFWSIFNRWRRASSRVIDYGLNLELFSMVHIAGLLFFYNLIVAMKSGDLTDNRLLFFCAGLVVAIYNVVQKESEAAVFEGYYFEEYQLTEDNDFGIVNGYHV